MGTVNVRRLDDELIGRLRRRAAENNRSLEGEVRHILEEAANGGMGEKGSNFRALSRSLRKQTSARSQTPSHLLIRNDRDHGHRPPA